MSNVVVTRSKLDNLAAAISGKSGESLPLTIDEMRVAVQNIPYEIDGDNLEYGSDLAIIGSGQIGTGRVI